MEGLWDIEGVPGVGGGEDVNQQPSQVKERVLKIKRYCTIKTKQRWGVRYLNHKHYQVINKKKKEIKIKLKKKRIECPWRDLNLQPSGWKKNYTIFF